MTIRFSELLKHREGILVNESVTHAVMPCAEAVSFGAKAKFAHALLTLW